MTGVWSGLILLTRCLSYILPRVPSVSCLDSLQQHMTAVLKGSSWELLQWYPLPSTGTRLPDGMLGHPLIE